MSHLTVKSFLQQNQHILSTRENSRRIKKKMKEKEMQKKQRELKLLEKSRKWSKITLFFQKKPP